MPSINFYPIPMEAGTHLIPHASGGMILGVVNSKLVVHEGEPSAPRTSQPVTVVEAKSPVAQHELGRDMRTSYIGGFFDQALGKYFFVFSPYAQ